MCVLPTVTSTFSTASLSSNVWQRPDIILDERLQNLEEMTSAAAEGWDPAKEAADLARLRAALSAQLEQVEQKMAALGVPSTEQMQTHRPVSNSAMVGTLGFPP